jgi:hypothetical protein
MFASLHTNQKYVYQATNVKKLIKVVLLNNCLEIINIIFYGLKILSQNKVSLLC